MPIVPPMIYGVTLWRLGVRLPVYYADAPPDERALAAEPRITAWVCQRTWRRDDEQPSVCEKFLGA